MDFENYIKSIEVDWDHFVKLSTTHYILPAIYCNLKKNVFLSFIPKDVVEYMKYLTDLNRSRNEEILDQLTQINNLLLNEQIMPIFIKGSANLISGLYYDIGVRMIGDIDFLVCKKDYLKAVEVLHKNGYNNLFKHEKNVAPGAKHYPRLIHSQKIAAVEVHKGLIKNKYNQEFNYELVKE